MNAFVAEIGIGTPEQVLTNVVLDTGSSIFWVNSNRCDASSCKMNYQFEHEHSTSYEEGDLTVEVHYGTGAVTGITAKDTIRMAGLEVEHQIIGEIEEETASVFASYGGVMGLSFPELAEEGVELIFDNIIEQGILN